VEPWAGADAPHLPHLPHRLKTRTIGAVDARPAARAHVAGGPAAAAASTENQGHARSGAVHVENVKMAQHLAQVVGITGEARGSFDADRMMMEPFKQILRIARAIGCPSRLALLQTLGEKGCSLSAAASTVGVSPSTAAHHLDVLMKAGLVTKTPRGRLAIYKWSRNRWQLARMSPPAATTPTMPEGEPS